MRADALSKTGGARGVLLVEEIEQKLDAKLLGGHV
jgi:hypothetical protein